MGGGSIGHNATHAAGGICLRLRPTHTRRCAALYRFPALCGGVPFSPRIQGQRLLSGDNGVSSSAGRRRDTAPVTVQAPRGIWGTLCERMRVKAAARRIEEWSLSAGCCWKVTFILLGDNLIFCSSNKGLFFVVTAQLMPTKDQERHHPLRLFKVSQTKAV